MSRRVVELRLSSFLKRDSLFSVTDSIRAGRSVRILKKLVSVPFPARWRIVILGMRVETIKHYSKRC